MTPGLPALKQVRLPAIQDAGHSAALDDLGKRAVVQVTAHGLPAHAHVLRDLTHAHAFLVEAHDLCVARQPPCTPLLAQPLVFCRRNYARLAGYLGCVALAQISRGGRDGYGGGQFLNRCCVEHRRRRCWLRHLIIGMGHARQSGMLTGQQALQRLAQIGQQMPSDPPPVRRPARHAVHLRRSCRRDRD